MAFYDKIAGGVLIIQERFQKLSAGQKRRFALICTAVFSLLLAIPVIASISSRSRENDYNKIPRAEIISPIPVEELFLPDEPDYVPGVLLGREQKAVWSEDFASEFWEDPLNINEEQWRQKLEAAIDDFLEGVP